MNRYVVEDMTTKAPESDLVATIYYEALNGYVRVFKDGTVSMISPAGTVITRFRELEKRDWLRESYILALITAGVGGKELTKALQAIARVDKRLATEADHRKGVKALERRSNARLRTWCQERGIDYDSLSEEQFAEIVSEGIRAIRGKASDTGCA